MAGDVITLDQSRKTPLGVFDTHGPAKLFGTCLIAVKFFQIYAVLIIVNLATLLIGILISDAEQAFRVLEIIIQNLLASPNTGTGFAN